MRTISALIVSAALVASLAACSSSSSAQSDAASCTPEATSGAASTLVSAKGSFGSKPTVEFPTPLVTKKVQVTTAITGKGDTLQAGDYADFQVSVWNAATGEFVTGTTFDAATPSRTHIGGSTGFGPILQCATVGSRVIGVSTLKQIFGDVDASADGLTADSSLVVVVDVQNGMIGKADGAQQIAQQGFPSVVTAPDGTPGVTIPSASAPTTLEHTVLKAGDGEKVKEGDKVVMQFEGLVWGDPGSVFKSTWEDTVPSTFLATKYNTTDGSGLFPGTEGAIIGQRVGSQVLVVVPAKSSYPSGSTAAPDGVADGSTRIYVFDILDITK